MQLQLLRDCELSYKHIITETHINKENTGIYLVTLFSVQFPSVVCADVWRCGGGSETDLWIKAHPL